VKKSCSELLNPMTKQSSSQTTQQQLISLYRRAIAQGISPAEVDKQVTARINRMRVSSQVETNETNQKISTLKKSLPWVVRIGALFVPLGFLAVGIYLVSLALGPIAYSYFQTGIFIQANQLVSPIPMEDVIDVTPLVINQVSADNREYRESVRRVAAPRIINEELDFTNLANWFGSSDLPDLVSGDGQAAISELEYTLEIPSLNITNAKVRIGGTDLNASLIAYPGTALPGEAGAPVIFGHSILRQFYNPNEKNPNRYNSIFSTIMTLKNGDKIYVTHDNVRYTYMVTDKTEVQPEDVYILNQRYDVKQLKLVTCVPEGTYLRRGVITAQLVEVEE
jgi:LPXTG-site transpeptidase (sortase) family protein